MFTIDNKIDILLNILTNRKAVNISQSYIPNNILHNQNKNHSKKTIKDYSINNNYIKISI